MLASVAMYPFVLVCSTFPPTLAAEYVAASRLLNVMPMIQAGNSSQTINREERAENGTRQQRLGV